MEQDKRPAPDSFEAMTDTEKAAARRAQLYTTLKANSSLGTYYQMYPDEQPKSALRSDDRDNERDR
jgi:hypothetical protein